MEARESLRHGSTGQQIMSERRRRLRARNEVQLQLKRKIRACGDYWNDQRPASVDVQVGAAFPTVDMLACLSVDTEFRTERYERAAEGCGEEKKNEVENYNNINNVYLCR